MFSIETRVNGVLVGCAYVHNEMLIEDGKDTYFVEYRRINKEPPVIRFNLKHNREEGIEKLSLLIYRELAKRLGHN